MDYHYKRKKVVVETHIDNMLSIRTKKTTETKVIRERLKSEKGDDERTPLKDLSSNPQKHADTFPRNKQITQKTSKPECVRANIFPAPSQSVSSAKKCQNSNCGKQTLIRESLQSKVENSVKAITGNSVRCAVYLRKPNFDHKNNILNRPINAGGSSTSGAIRKSIQNPQITNLQKYNKCSISPITKERNFAIKKDLINQDIEDSIISGTKIQESQKSFMVSKDQTDINLENVTFMARKLLARQDTSEVKCSNNKENNIAETTRKKSTILTKSIQANAVVNNKLVNKSITIVSGNSSVFTKQHPISQRDETKFSLEKYPSPKYKENASKETSAQLDFGTYCVANSNTEDSFLENSDLDKSQFSNTLQPHTSNASIVKKTVDSSTQSSKSVQFQNVTGTTNNSSKLAKRPGTPHHTKSTNSIDSSCYDSMSEDPDYQSCEQSENISPIKPNIFTTNCTLILSPGEAKEVPRKTTLIHKMQQNKRNRFAESSPYTLDIFVSDYIEDIIQYLLTINNNFLLKRNFLQNYNPCKESRNKILNWIMKMQKQLCLSTEHIFIVTRLFDNILARSEIPRNMYQLVVLTICWIVAKCYSAYVLPATRLLKLCANAYTPQQLLKMEIKIMKVFKFSFVMNDPGIFGTYYMNKLNIENEHQIRYCVLYILESFALCHHFSTFQSSELAAGALYLTLKCLYPSELIYQRLSGILAYHHPTEIRDISELMYIQLQKISDPNCEVGEPFRKYSVLEMKKVSILLQSSIRQPIGY